jgi:UDP-N-acetylmuramate: L-alanyl-gamma-D-glutamyl-meso-diaminopimelate ligase
MHIHILGICGTFMGGIAVLARAAGHRVTGCDANVYPPMSDQLAALGIDLITGYNAEQMKLRPDVYVIGNVVTRGNPLIEAVLNAGDRYVSGPQWLADNVLQDRHVLAVAGTHGKTTTTSMLSWILDCAGLSSGFLIGGVASDHGVSARLHGKPGSVSKYFVVEADEYDTAFFDKRSKFVHYRPRTAILNNLEYDHADIFPDVAAIKRQFHHLVRTIPSSGRIICNGTDKALDDVIAMGCWSERESFNTESGWHLTRDGLVDFGGERFGALHLTMPGEHNAMNALAAIAAARHVGVSVADSLDALARFSGVKRRLELREEVAGVRVYDDFAHHPTAIEATVRALRRQSKSGERVIAVFEPRSNTMKLGAMRAVLADSLREADIVFGYSGGVDWDLATALASLGTKATDVKAIDELVEKIALVARSGDRIVFMSNGAFGGVHQKMIDRLGAAT